MARSLVKSFATYGVPYDTKSGGGVGGGGGVLSVSGPIRKAGGGGGGVLSVSSPIRKAGGGGGGGGVGGAIGLWPNTGTYGR